MSILFPSSVICCARDLKCPIKLIKVDLQRCQSAVERWIPNFEKLLRNSQSGCTLLCRVVELLQLLQLYNFAKLLELLKVQLNVLLMLANFIFYHLTTYARATEPHLCRELRQLKPKSEL